MNLFFRSPEPTDLEKVLEMMEAFYRIDQYPFDASTTNKNLQYFLNNPALGRIWLILSDQNVIGYLVLAFGYSFEYQGRDAFLDEFFIVSPYRGKGIGRKTIEFLESEARRLDVRAIHLEVERHNKKAQNLYKNYGFMSNDRLLMTKLTA